MYTFAKLSVLSRIVWIDPLVREVTLSEHLHLNTDCCLLGGVSDFPLSWPLLMFTRVLLIFPPHVNKVSV